MGIECARSIYRGVRVAGKETVVGSARSLPALLEQLKAAPGDDIRLALSGMKEARSDIIDNTSATNSSSPLDGLDLQRPARELIWDQIPLGPTRRLLFLAPLSAINDEWTRLGIPADFPFTITAVGLETAALVAAAADLPGASPVIWADESATWLIERSDPQGRAINLRPARSQVPANVRILVGPLARARISWAKDADAGLAGGLDPDYFVAWGATRWGSRAFPWAPNLEPYERRQIRTKKRRGQRQRRLAWISAAALFLASLALPFPARWNQTRVDSLRDEAQKRTLAAEASILEAGALGERLAPSGRDLAEQVAMVLLTADTMVETIQVDQIEAEIIRLPFKTLHLARHDDRETGVIRVSGYGTEREQVMMAQRNLLRLGLNARIREISSILGNEKDVAFAMEIRTGGNP